MTYLLYILLAILMFGVLIALHELGHFISAKALGVKVNEFAVGMGPRIWGRQGAETAYSLRLLPIGGFCAMEGEDEDSPDPRAFGSVSLWRRFVILVAGSAMNFLAGVVIVLLLLLVGAKGTSIPVIASVDAAGPAAVAIQAGDRVLKVDDRAVFTSLDISLLFARSQTGRVILEVERGGTKITLPVQLQKNEQGSWIMGVNLQTIEVGLLTGLRESSLTAISFVRMVFIGLTDLLSGRAGLQDLSGPIGIVGAVGQMGAEAKTIADGLDQMLYFMAIIAVNLAVMNLLPIPALDGGRILFLLVGGVYTQVTRRKLNPKVEGYINAAGLICLLALMAVVAVSDIWKFF